MTGEMRLYTRVPEFVLGPLRSAVDLCPALTPIQHSLIINVDCRISVADPDGRSAGFACFYAPPESPKDYRQPVCITVTTGIVGTLMREHGYSRAAAAQAVVENFFHELVHYEQWRDGRPLNHRGVERRTRTLLDTWIESTGRKPHATA